MTYTRNQFFFVLLFCVIKRGKALGGFFFVFVLLLLLYAGFVYLCFVVREENFIVKFYSLRKKKMMKVMRVF